MYKILNSLKLGDVMIVAVMGGIDWAAYQGIINHDEDDNYNEQVIAAYGTKLSEDIARKWFGYLETLIYRR